jgi:hypothetical protein
MSKPQIVTAAAGLHDQPGEDVDQGRLARAVGAEQPEDLAARHVEADLVERALAAGIGLRSPPLPLPHGLDPDAARASPPKHLEGLRRWRALSPI